MKGPVEKNEPFFGLLKECQTYFMIRKFLNLRIFDFFKDGAKKIRTFIPYSVCVCTQTEKGQIKKGHNKTSFVLMEKNIFKKICS